jgi:D-alanine-D-alanine ligase
MYEEESPLKNEEDFYNYQTPDASFLQNICQVSFNAYKAVRGKGYCRVDIRMDKQTGKLFVLEVNAQCGLSEDENFTSIGAILRLSGNSFASLIIEIITDTLTRKSDPKKKLAKQLELI